MKQITRHAIIPDTFAEQRLDQALSQLFSEFSRSQLQEWIKSGQVKVDQQVCSKPRTKVMAGQEININAELADKEHWQAQHIPLEILHEDEDVIVINKPAGLVVHPGAGNPDNTLVNALLHHAPELSKLPRAGLIHRLDKDTSGVLVIARNLSAHHHLIKEMQARNISRQYLAVVQGVMISGGTIEGNIGRDPRHRTRMAVVESGKPAVTHYRVLEKFRAHTYLQVNLETGRTHQIRVHFAHMNYPLLGDPVYGKCKALEKRIGKECRAAIAQFKRQALHAAKLELTHPGTQQQVAWEAPLPSDMIDLLDALQEDVRHAK